MDKELLNSISDGSEEEVVEKKRVGRPKKVNNKTENELAEEAIINEYLQEEVDELVQKEESSDTIFDDGTGPTLEDVEKWKSIYDEEVFITDFGSQDIYVWRPLKRSEYRNIIKEESRSTSSREETIVQAVLLWPTNINVQIRNDGKAGIPTVLSEMILENSGFNPNTRTYKL